MNGVTIRLNLDDTESRFVPPQSQENWDEEPCEGEKPFIDVGKQENRLSDAQRRRVKAERRRRQRQSRREARQLGSGDLKRGRELEDQFLNSLRLDDTTGEGEIMSADGKQFMLA